MLEYNLKNTMKIIGKVRNIIGLLFVMVSSTVISAPLEYSKSLSCSNLVYLDAVNGAALKEYPVETSRTVMQIHNRQYLCVVKNNDANTWIMVRKVPLLVKKNQIKCEELGLPKGCTKIADFPTKWKITKPKGTQCKLKSRVNNTGQLVVFTQGVCATGWVKAEELRYFAD